MPVRACRRVGFPPTQVRQVRHWRTERTERTESESDGGRSMESGSHRVWVPREGGRWLG